MSIKHMSVAEVARAYTKLVRQMQDMGIEPVSWEVGVYEAKGECMPLGTRVLHQTEITVSDDDYMAYDRGALCEELDGVLGDLIERTMHRYMSKSAAQEERRDAVKHFADRIIARDKSNSHPS